MNWSRQFVVKCKITLYTGEDLLGRCKSRGRKERIMQKNKTKHLKKRLLFKWLSIMLLTVALLLEQTFPSVIPLSQVLAAESTTSTQGNDLSKITPTKGLIRKARQSEPLEINQGEESLGSEEAENTGEESLSEETENTDEESIGSEEPEDIVEEDMENNGNSEDTEDIDENADGNDSENENEITGDIVSSGDAAGTDQTARAALENITAERTILALVYLSASYPIRDNPSYAAKTLVNVPSGQQVQIQGESLVDNGELWTFVTLTYQGTPYEGYIPRNYLACSDELFLQWEKTYQMQPAKRLRSLRSVTGYPEIDQFPDSYRDALLALKQAHPNWTFVMQSTNLDWNTVVANEMILPRSLVPDSYPVYQKQGTYGTTGWSYATEDTLKYYLDPRNWVQEVTIFQFELLTYNATYHTEASVQNFLNATFMAGIMPGSEQTYANAFWNIGSMLNVSPFHLACRVYQEQGQGQSPLISGTYPGYEGLYNYFNIGATGSTKEEEIVTGLTKAREQNWTTPLASLSGGAAFVSQNYILRGQDTLYLQKFDVDSSDGDLYWHQYMQNIVAPVSEGKNIRKSYVNAGSLDNTFVFKIPVYENMPQQVCTNPTPYGITVNAPAEYLTAYGANQALGSIWVDGVEYTSFLGTAAQSTVYVAENAKTAVMYQYNETGIPTGMYVWILNYDPVTQKYLPTGLPEFQDLLTYVGFSIRINGNSGIRFQNGFSAQLKEQLVTAGVSGFTLKEYGTLIMTAANHQVLPFVKDGNKVISGLSYGMTENGLKDDVLSTVEGRQQFTAVLVNLPVAQYKTELYFRSYCILTAGGQDFIFYGPERQNSIYTLAQRYLNSGRYPEGSVEDVFLKQIISDADAVTP
jgi:beta-N-acetylglucosaminidase